MPTKKKSSIQSETAKIARLIYSGKLKQGQVDQQSIRLMAEEMTKGLFQGYGKNLGKIDPEATDYRILSKMEDNVHVFSGFKSYRELKEISQLLVKDGKLVSKQEFLQAVKRVDKTYNQNYKEAEYDLAVTSAQQAKNWNDIQKEKEKFPMLKYSSVLDGHETVLCHTLDARIYPVDHDFWKTYYPPNHWRCRSGVIPLADGEQSNDEPELYPKLAPMFQNNVGINGEVFPDSHPYFDLPVNKVEYLKKHIGILVPGRWENYKQYKTLVTKGDHANLKFYKESGGFTATHKYHGKTELANNEIIADELAKDGYGVILKGLNKKGTSSDASLFKKGDWEFKNVKGTSANTIQQNIRDAKRQSENIVLFLNNKLKPHDLSQGIWNAVGLHDKKGKVQKLTIKMKGKKSLQISRDEILNTRAAQLIEDFLK